MWKTSGCCAFDLKLEVLDKETIHLLMSSLLYGGFHAIYSLDFKSRKLYHLLIEISLLDIKSRKIDDLLVENNYCTGLVFFKKNVWI